MEIEQQLLTELLVQTGPIGIMIVVLGKMIQKWFANTDAKIATLAAADSEHGKSIQQLQLEDRDTKRRIDAIERERVTTGSHPTVRRP